MPRSTRWKIKQSLDSAGNQLSKAQEICGEVGMLYEKDHPDYYQALSAIVQAVELIKNNLKTVRDSV